MSDTAQESLGARLSAARSAAGLTIAAAAARLRCDESLLAALEAERFADLGAPVFVQGHLRRYADLLGLPVEPLLAAWAARQASAVAVPDLTQVPRPNRPVRIVDPGKLARPLAMIAATVVIALAIGWILQGAGTAVSPTIGSPPTLESEPLPEPVNEPVNTGEAIVPDAITPSTTAPTPSASVSPVPAAPVTAAAAPIASAAAAPPPNATGSLVLVVGDECWVEIFDAAGTRRHFDLARAGERVSVSGPAPWRVVVGRAEVVTLEVGGRRVTIPPSLVRNATAYLSVDAAGRLQAVEGLR